MQDVLYDALQLSICGTLVTKLLIFYEEKKMAQL